MASFRKAGVQDSKVMSIIAAARQVKGIHVYLDEPDDKINKSYDSPVYDLAKTGTKHVGYKVVFRATGDKPNFAFGVGDGVGSALEMGINESNDTAYGAREDNKSWHQLNAAQTAGLKSGDYGVMAAEVEYPQQGSQEAKIKYEFNGVTLRGDSKYSATDVSKLFRRIYYHSQNFERVEVLEWHFEYTGITQSLKPTANAKYISLKYINYALMSAGSIATVTGKYKAQDAQYDGIAIGIQKTGGNEAPDIHAFAGHKDTSKTVTFHIAVSDMTSIVHSPSESAYLDKAPAGDEMVCLVVQNIDIENLEIHTGRVKKG